MEKFPSLSITGDGTIVWVDVTEAIQLYLHVLEHLLKYGDRESVSAGDGVSLIRFADHLKKVIISKNPSEIPLSYMEFEV